MSKTPWYIRYGERHKPDQIITANNEGSPYLHRWHLIPRNRFFNIYLHHFIGSDQRVMHDHPWISLAYHLAGSMEETYQDPYFLSEYRRKRLIVEGNWTYRNSKFLHYLTPEQVFPCWTLFMTGPKLKPWGFQTKDGWRPWRQVLPNLNPDEKDDY